MVVPSTSKTIEFALLGGFFGAIVMGVIALMMLVPTPMGAEPFFVAAAMIMGLGSMAYAAGWLLHLMTGVIIGGIFGFVVAKISSLQLRTPSKAIGLGAAAGVVAFFVWFLPMMAMLMPALMGMPMMVAGGFAAHVIYGLVLGGVASLAISKGGSSFKCPTCNANFSTRDELMQHSKVHMSNKPQKEFKCPACGMTFATQQELMDHKAKAHPM